MSFRNFAEAQPFAGAAISVFDLKEPFQGALGRPSLNVARKFVAGLKECFSKHFDDVTRPRISIAIGELFDPVEPARSVLAHPEWQTVLNSFDYVKAGLSAASSVENWQANWLDAYSQLSGNSQLVPVAYADAAAVGAPDLNQLFALCEQITARHSTPSPFTMLLDTYQKKDVDLFSFINDETLKSLVERAKEKQIRLAIAGSLRVQTVGRLLNGAPEIVGVRSAVCLGEDRQATVDAKLLNTFLSTVKHAFENKIN